MPTADLLGAAADRAPWLVSWLLTYLLHSTVLLGLVLLATRWVRRDAWRDLLWKTALLGGVLTATVQQALPRSPLGGRMVVAARAELPWPVVTDPVVPAAGEAPLASPAVPDHSTRSEPAGSSWAAPSPTTLVAGGWLAIAALLLLGLAWDRLRLAARLRRRRAVDDPALLATLAELQQQTGIRRRVKLSATTAVSSPLALGFREICLPEAAVTALAPEQQRALLAHELAHLARLDPLWLVLAGVIERVLFVQPLNRLARIRMQVAAEYVCDQWAVGRTGSGLGLARCLVQVAEWLDASPATTPVAGMAENRSQLVDRVRRLIEEAPMPAPAWNRRIVPIAAGMLVLTVIAVPGFTASPGDADRPDDDVAAMKAAESGGDPAAFQERATPDPGTERAALPIVPVTAQRGDTDRVVTALIAALGDPDVEVRRAVIGALGNHRDLRALPGLTAALRDADAEVRAGAIEAIAALRDRRTATSLVAALRDDAPSVRQAAVQALAELEVSEAVEPLIPLLSDPNAEVRHAAADALGNLGDRRAVPGLITALSDASAEVRHAAAHGLGHLEDPRAAEALGAALSDSSNEVRAAALEAIGELELAQLPAPVIGALRDRDAEVRHAAVHAVGRHRDARAVPALRDLLTDTSPEVREGAIEALAEIRSPEALAIIADALKSQDPNVRKLAAEALGRR